jgi:hypothetical protein
MVLTRKSEAQANAEALARRSSAFAVENRRSWTREFDRPTHEPRTLRGYVLELRDAYEAEVPTRLHRHDVDGGGTPAFTAAFEQWLWGSPLAVDEKTGMYRGPLRACLADMARSADARSQSRSRIAYLVVAGGLSPMEAAIREDVPAHWAEIVGEDALRVTWRRLVRGPLPPGIPAA